jgi:hypothetical protein
MEKDELLHPLGFDRCTSGIRTRAGPTELPGNCDTGRVRCKVRQHRREKRAGTDQTRAPVHGKPNSGREQNIHYRTQWTSYHGRKVVALTLGLMAKWANSRTSGSSEMRKKTRSKKTPGAAPAPWTQRGGRRGHGGSIPALSTANGGKERWRGGDLSPANLATEFRILPGCSSLKPLWRRG